MSAQTKKQVLIVIAIVAFLMALLAFSLTGLVLKQGEPLPPSKVEGGFNVPTFWGGGSLFILILRGFLALLIICLPVYIVMNLLTPKGRRQLLIDLIILIIFTLVALALSKVANQQAERQPVEDQQQQQVPGQLPTAQATGQEPPTFEPQTQSWMVTLTVVIVSLVLAAFLFAIFRKVLRRNPVPGELERLADNAQQAVRSIGLGVNFENVIVQCYVEMSQTIQQARGIQRSYAMTPLEFQQHLVKAGVPSEPVGKLTRLFEMVRYGHLAVGDSGKREAVESLNQIISYCRSLG